MQKDQKYFCKTVSEFITDISIKCVILDQVIATRERRLANNDSNDFQCEESNLKYTLSVSYEISSDSSGVSASIDDRINSREFKDSITAALGGICFTSAEVAASPTQSPSYTQSTSPTTTSAPSVQPTISTSPSFRPRISSRPTPMPSTHPSSQPSLLPSTSGIPSKPFNII